MMIIGTQTGDDCFFQTLDSCFGCSRLNSNKEFGSEKLVGVGLGRLRQVHNILFTGIDILQKIIDP